MVASYGPAALLWWRVVALQPSYGGVLWPCSPLWWRVVALQPPPWWRVVALQPSYGGVLWPCSPLWWRVVGLQPSYAEGGEAPRRNAPFPGGETRYCHCCCCCCCGGEYTLRRNSLHLYLNPVAEGGVAPRRNASQYATPLSVSRGTAVPGDWFLFRGHFPTSPPTNQTAASPAESQPAARSVSPAPANDLMASPIPR
ncbi:hypothetical protein CRUP_013358 [Coryphaenoides rupestris]|nr:hypothetical protein CRUP_013358 [Coryphaenoides rupestris]